MQSRPARPHPSRTHFKPLGKALLAILSVLVWFPALSSPTRDMSGNWLGTLIFEQTKLRLLFKISKTPEGAWSAAMDSLDQGVKDMPVEGVKVDGTTLHLEVKMLKGVYEVQLDSTASKAEGKFMTSGESLPL